MTEEEYEAAVATTQIREAGRLAARRVLVHGWSVTRAGQEAGRTKQWARQAVARVQRAHRELVGCPQGWEIVSVRLPAADAEEVRDLERRRLDELIG